MIPRILSIASPVFVYLTLAVLIWGLFRERRKLELPALALAAAGLVASLVFLAPTHRLFFDEDIYINLASNLTHTPAVRATILGSPEEPRISTYYKEPPGWPVLLSLVFLVTGRSETVAFFIARVFFALTIAAVYQLARAVLETRRQAIVASVIFAAVPVTFWFSVSAGTDIPAAFFATLGMWGCLAGNGALASAGLALAAQTRMELIVLVALVGISRDISIKWKATAVALVVAEIVHIGWVMFVAPTLAAAEKVPAVFSLSYLQSNLIANVKYLLNPMEFPAALTLLAVAGALSGRLRGTGRFFAAAIGALFCIYLVFYAGSFTTNARYCIQIIAPLVVLGTSVLKRPLLIAAVILSVVLPYAQSIDFATDAQALTADHNLSVQFASGLGPNDLVISTEPEVFLNRGVSAMNAAFAPEHNVELIEEMRRRGGAWYHSGVRAAVVNSDEWRADQWLKSHFELQIVSTHEAKGSIITFYKVKTVLY